MDISRFKMNGDETPLVAVSLTHARNPPPFSNYHTGILYRNENDGQVYWLHLAWHKRLEHQAYAGESACAIPGLEHDEALYMAEFVALLANCAMNRDIPYSLTCDPGVTFDEVTAEVSFPPGTAGLTCASFVLAAFRSAGPALLDEDSWPAAGDAEDVATHRALVDFLKNSRNPDTAAQGRAEEANIGCRRIKPEQVAGACLEDLPPPARHPECVANAAAIVAILEAPPAPTPVAP